MRDDIIRYEHHDRSLENHLETGLRGGKKTSYGNIALVQMGDDGRSGEMRSGRNQTALQEGLVAPKDNG